MQSIRQQANSKRHSLLIIADDQSFADRVAPLLDASNCQCEHTLHPEQARWDLPQLEVDAVLLYLPKPPLARAALNYKLHELSQFAPVIVIADKISAMTGQLLLASGAYDYLALNDLQPEKLRRALRYSVTQFHSGSILDELERSDKLTSIPNRHSFYHQLLNALESSQQQEQQVALYLIDLDGFRDFNRRHGQATGDEMILQFCNRLKAAAGDHLLARLGNEEFALLARWPAQQNIERSSRALTQQLVQKLIPPYRIDGKEIMLAASMGISFAPKHADTLDELMRCAGQAHSRAKQQHGSSFAVYQPLHDASFDNNADTEAELWAALRTEQLVLYYQPRIELKTNKIVGAEALMRWQHPEKGLVPPSDFIPVAEATGLIVPMGYWAIHRAGSDRQTLLKAGLQPGSIGVNLSFRQFKDDFLPTTIERIARQLELEPGDMEFELTESALFSDIPQVTSSIDRLSALGFEFSLDDFGTGYSSFSALQKLPISTLKIDRSFVAGAHNNKSDAEIVRAIINLAHNLNKNVIAEGVENKEQLDFLLQHNCDQVQGYYYSPPVSLEEFTLLLKNN